MSKDLRSYIRQILNENDDIIYLKDYMTPDPLEALLIEFDERLVEPLKEIDLNSKFYRAALNISKILKSVLETEDEDEEFPKMGQEDFLAMMKGTRDDKSFEADYDDDYEE